MARPRPHMPVKVKLDAAILQLGLDPADVDFDHDPALGIRVFDEATGKYEPDANDPRFITVRSRERDGEGHKAKTFGTGGTTAGSDVHRIAKIRRLEKARAALAEAEGRTTKPRSKIPSRPFPQGQRKLRSRNTFERRA
jgi:hypothetical protein